MTPDHFDVTAYIAGIIGVYAGVLIALISIYGFLLIYDRLIERGKYDT